MNNKKFIFIGGTGRSGTGVLSKILDSHKEIYRLPFELRLQVDPDGLLDLKHALTNNWDIYHANVAISRFVKFYNKLDRFTYDSYHRYSFDRLTSKEVINHSLQEFLNVLGIEKEKRLWTGNSPLFPKLVSKTPFPKRIKNKFYPAFYFSEWQNSKLYNEAANNLYYKLFADVFKSHAYVADHTPYNFLYFKELNEIFPEAKFIHTYRNPLDIATSYNKMRWGSIDLSRDVRSIISFYNKWFEVKNKSDNYIEIPMEGFVEKPEQQLRYIAQYLGVKEESIDLNAFSKEKANINRWKSKKEILHNMPHVEELYEIANKLGYKV